MILICLGGAYSYYSSREAEPIARAYMARGYNAEILYYTCKEKAETLYDAEKDVTKPHFEVAKSICIIRSNAEEWNVDPDKIAVIGFSAGEHLAGCASILWNDERLVKALVKAGASCEVHIIPQGGHGFSLAEREVLPHPNHYVSRWLGWAIDWLETIFDF